MPPFAEPRLTPVRATLPAGAPSGLPEPSRSSQTASAAARSRRRNTERRRRERHMRLLRRDLLVDVVLSLVVMVVMLIVTAGLGVIALIEILAGAMMIASFVVRRWSRRRQLVSGHRRRPEAASRRSR